MSTHKAIAIVKPGVIDAIQVPTQEPGHGELLLKVEYSSLIPFDTYMSDLGYATTSYPTIVGFNASGNVSQLGPGIDDLAVGDRITAFSFTSLQSKGMQEYSVQPRAVCSKVPDTIPLDEAATIPDNFVTAFFTLFNQLNLPVPSSFPATVAPPHASTPILIYGAGSTAGQYSVQLLNAAGYRKILVTASTKHHAFLRSLGATDTFDYNSPELVSDIANAVGGNGQVALAVDCICAETTMALLAQVISPTGTVALLLPIKKSSGLLVKHANDMVMGTPEDNRPFAQTVKLVGVRTFLYLEADTFLRDNLMPKILPSLLTAGIIKPNRVRLQNQGSFKERVEQGMDLLRNNKISGEKVVVQIPVRAEY